MPRQPYSEAVKSDGEERLHPLPFCKGRGLGSGLRIPSSQEGNRGVEKTSLMGKAVPMSTMKVHFQIAECSPLYQKKEGRVDFRKTALINTKEGRVGFRKKLIHTKYSLKSEQPIYKSIIFALHNKELQLCHK